MLTLLFIVLGIIIFALVAVYVINKFLPAKARFIVSIVLWIATAVFVYLIYDSIQEPIRFNEEKEKRYRAAVDKLLDLKKSQAAYNDIKGKYAPSFDSLIKFIESEKFEIIERRDTMVIDYAKNATYNIKVGADGVGGYFKPEVIFIKKGFISVKDSLFKGTERYKSMDKVKINDFEVPVKLEIGSLEFKDKTYSTMKATIDKNALLKGMDEDLIKQENKKKSIDEISGDQIILGNLDDINLTGNWPKKYGSNE